MNWQALIERLPPEWFEVVTILLHSLCAYPHQRVAMWWHRSRKQLRWTEFLDFLTQLEPQTEGCHLVL